ncbi:M15 family peptidase [Roseobacter sp.]|uniref:M15 family peptidase n=1 Tax=Roseobacter sp. TaxID=1907202 RepID=UPI00296716E8|nr:M15 family peptidase [Roseobacter sp.]MDW3181785.1 M15 family peptidase [Roseobacter sp.]
MNALTQKYRLGRKSRAEMKHMHPDLIRVIEFAIGITEQDFTVFDGYRSAADQHALYKRGASQLDGYQRISKHQVQPDGYVHAADLVPWRDSDGDGDLEVDWHWPSIYLIADAMFVAARCLDVQLRWGGCWQHINPLTAPPEQLVQMYVKRKRAAGKRAFNDGPHWELFGY